MNRERPARILDRYDKVLSICVERRINQGYPQCGVDPAEPACGDGRSGTSVYGIGPAKKWYRPPVTPVCCFRHVWGNSAEVWNEFTVHQCLDPAAMTYAVLHGPEQSAPKANTKERTPS